MQPTKVLLPEPPRRKRPTSKKNSMSELENTFRGTHRLSDSVCSPVNGSGVFHAHKRSVAAAEKRQKSRNKHPDNSSSMGIKSIDSQASAASMGRSKSKASLACSTTVNFLNAELEDAISSVIPSARSGKANNVSPLDGKSANSSIVLAKTPIRCYEPRLKRSPLG